MMMSSGLILAKQHPNGNGHVLLVQANICGHTLNRMSEERSTADDLSAGSFMLLRLQHCWNRFQMISRHVRDGGII